MASNDDELGQILDAVELGYSEAVKLGESGIKEFTENATARQFARRSSSTLRYNHTTPQLARLGRDGVVS